MREESPITNLRLALRRRGVWGTRAGRLLRDWAEHVREAAAQGVAEGANAEAAEKAAWRALGEPAALATQAAQELARGSWMGRYPWLAGLVLPTVAWLVILAALVAGPAWFIEIFRRDSMSPVHALTVKLWECGSNWLPWILSMMWLGWLVRRMPGGWKHFWITAIVLTLLSGSFQTSIHPPFPFTPNSGSINIMAVGPLALVVGTIAILCHLLPTPASWGWPSPLMYPVPWVQMAISLAGVLAVRWWVGGKLRVGWMLRVEG